MKNNLLNNLKYHLSYILWFIIIHLFNFNLKMIFNLFQINSKIIKITKFIGSSLLLNLVLIKQQDSES